MIASHLSAGAGDVCASASGTEAAQMLDLRADVPNVTCVRKEEINRFASFPLLTPLRTAVSICLARVSAKWDSSAETQPMTPTPRRPMPSTIPTTDPEQCRGA